MQKLSTRLQAVADFVTPGNRVADIGTDHGFLPVYLVQSGKCPSAVAMDLRMGPLDRAREHIEAAELTDRIQIRLSDGMASLEKGEADSAVMAGMGGLTVIQILTAAQSLLPDLKELVTEPQSDIAKVRRWLREHRMYIDREDLVLEAGKFYPVLHVVMHEPEIHKDYAQNKETLMHMLRKKLSDEQEIRQLLDQYGECLLSGRHPELAALLERDKKREQKIIRQLAAGTGADRKDRKKHVKRQNQALLRVQEIELLLEQYLQ